MRIFLSPFCLGLFAATAASGLWFGLSPPFLLFSLAWLGSLAWMAVRLANRTRGEAAHPSELDAQSRAFLTGLNQEARKLEELIQKSGLKPAELGIWNQALKDVREFLQQAEVLVARRSKLVKALQQGGQTQSESKQLLVRIDEMLDSASIEIAGLREKVAQGILSTHAEHLDGEAVRQQLAQLSQLNQGLQEASELFSRRIT